MILVMGATGNIGSKISQQLISSGQNVRCVARHFPDKDAYRGADLRIGDANDVAFLTDCMRGCTAAFTMIPPNYSAQEVRFYQNKFGEVIAEAIEESGIKKIVNLSSIGADLESGTGPVLGLHDQEQRLDELTDADIVHLRPAYFMENLYSGIPSIISMGKYFNSIPGDAPIHMVATKDIASRAAFLLSNPDFDNKVPEYLLGERTLTFTEVCRILSSAIGRNIEYVESPSKEIKNYLIGAGLPEDWADQYIELNEAMSNGTINATVSRDKVNTTETSLEQFAKDFFVPTFNKALADDKSRKTRSSSQPEATP